MIKVMGNFLVAVLIYLIVCILFLRTHFIKLEGLEVYSEIAKTKHDI